MLVVAVVVSVVGGCELWARSWEQRWVDFKAHWEAQGEVFDMAAHLPPVVDDALNFAKHPWVAAVVSQKPAVLERLGRMSPDEIPGYTDWLYAEKLVPMPEDLAQRVAAHCEPFAADFVALAEAAGRPHCRVELKFDDGFHLPPMWLGKVSPCSLITALNLDAMTRYDELTRQRFKKPSEFEAIAAGQRFATSGIAAGLWRAEEDRQPARMAVKEPNRP